MMCSFSLKKSDVHPSSPLSLLLVRINVLEASNCILLIHFSENMMKAIFPSPPIYKDVHTIFCSKFMLLQWKWTAFKSMQ